MNPGGGSGWLDSVQVNYALMIRIPIWQNILVKLADGWQVELDLTTVHLGQCPS